MSKLLIVLLLSGCAITPELSVRPNVAVDFRMADKPIRQRFSVANPHMGSYATLNFDYKF